MFPFIYLGFLSMATAFATVTASAMKKVFDIFWRSQWLFSGSLVMPARMASGSSLYSEGIGPASRSPSKRSASRGQDLMRTVGRLSLKINTFISYLSLSFVWVPSPSLVVWIILCRSINLEGLSTVVCFNRNF